jgi:hypothetical protein
VAYEGEPEPPTSTMTAVDARVTVGKGCALPPLPLLLLRPTSRLTSSEMLRGASTRRLSPSVSATKRYPPGPHAASSSSKANSTPENALEFARACSALLKDRVAAPVLSHTACSGNPVGDADCSDGVCDAEGDGEGDGESDAEPDAEGGAELARATAEPVAEALGDDVRDPLAAFDAEDVDDRVCNWLWVGERVSLGVGDSVPVPERVPVALSVGA